VAVRLETYDTYSRIHVDVAADIGNAAELQDALERAMPNAHDLRVALSRTDGIDLAALQVLWAAGCALAAGGGQLTVETAEPEELRTLLSKAGMAALPFELIGM
jgi:anti-anti-sigma regulatory factor